MRKDICNDIIDNKRILCYASDMNNELLENTLQENTIFINETCRIEVIDDAFLVKVSGILLYHFDESDQVTQKFVAVSLYKDGLAKQSELASAFNVAPSTIYRWEKEYDKDGIKGLDRKKHDYKPIKVTKPIEKSIKILFPRAGFARNPRPEAGGRRAV